ncbi:hypothetical protein CK203_003667 [Vitis vinifera]|uniref:Transposon Ty3-I Gag-Pol polyprotein n=1 Tax=Vitis vinifera TaxID=29760 RepID=A0A438K8S2_VITVI|nr:hypothetical protein CK203_003667 [Vitis vinifera]
MENSESLYTNLNDACPKDSFMLPRIDEIVDVISGHMILSFIDAFSGYHQIPMFQPDGEKTAFVTPHGLGASAIDWTDECRRAFNEVKHYLTEPPILSSSQYGEQIYMYLAVSNYALKIKNLYFTSRYPQSNGQTEVINKTILTALKKKLEMAKRKWVDELLGVLWAYQTTPGWPTKTTSYALTYGMEVVIPIEIGMSTTKTIIQGQMDEIMSLESTWIG